MTLVDQNVVGRSDHFDPKEVMCLETGSTSWDPDDNQKDRIRQAEGRNQIPNESGRNSAGPGVNRDIYLNMFLMCMSRLYL